MSGQNVTKRAIREYLELTFDKRNAEARKARDTYVKGTFDVELDAFLQSITGEAANFGRQLLKVYENGLRDTLTKLRLLDSHRISIDGINYIESYSTDLVRTIRANKRTDYMKLIDGSKSHDAINTGCPEIDAMIAKYREDKEWAALNKRVEDLKTLRAQLGAIVDSAPSGKVAYEQLRHLGVDLTGLTVQSQLPAVISLSVDVCLVNGGC